MSRAADLLIRNARPWSDGSRVAGADAIAVGNGEILAVGPAAALEGLAGTGTRRLDAGGATVTPGLCDAHLHLVAWARAKAELRLEGLARRRDVLEAVSSHCAAHPGGGPVIGRGWAEDGWEAPPDRAALDQVAPGRVVILHSKDYHALWVSGAALERAGVTRATPDPPGGKIERTRSGEPSGVVREHATRLFDAVRPARTAESDGAAVAAAAADLLGEGVTAVHDFEGDHESAVLEAMARRPGRRVRVLMHVPAAALDRALAAGIRSAQGDDWFRWGALKLFADGTLGSRTAAMLEPYEGTSERGMDLMSGDDLRATVARSFAGGLSVAVHAIGDRAVRASLDAFEAAGPPPALPPRVEHAQLVHEDDLPRFAKLGVAASMQPLHCTADRPLAEKWWGARARRSYPWRALLDRGARLAFGSDAPVEEPSVAWGLHAAMTRERRGAQDGPFTREQSVSLDEALTAYTEAPARLAGWWPRIGRLAAGAAADLVIWSRDLHRLPPPDLALARPRWTVLAGDVVFAGAGEPSGAARFAPGSPA